jgi:alanyl-tRNA synthetase
LRTPGRADCTHHCLRRSFLDYFKGLEHTIVRSSSLVPQDDPTLLFANAGMNQFKPYFLGQKVAPYPRAASVQKCIRASGKHNDLEEVGQDEWHHTFFEMLGNWSFGDYYKREAIEWAWRFVTAELGLPEDRLWASVYEKDTEARGFWQCLTPLPPERILGFGAEDNFWEMGETGPCGPCSEIHFDMGAEHGCGDPACGPNCPRCHRFVEIWNLVFIQFDRDSKGTLHELPAKHVDTGMGLERTLAVLQGKPSDYATDLFLPLIRRVEELSGHDFADEQNRVAMRAIADHVRALVFAIADGAMPSNEGRGWVVRGILRRAARYGRTLGLHDPFLYDLAPRVVDIMGEPYPEIRQRSEHVSLVIKAEEEGFGRTLDRGLDVFETEVSRLSGGDTLPGDVAFLLHATYGFPLHLTQLMARERGLIVDTEAFEREMASHRDVSSGRTTILVPITLRSVQVGLDHTDVETTVQRVGEEMLLGGKRAFPVELKETPFYADIGVGPGDTGRLACDGCDATVLGTRTIGNADLPLAMIEEGELTPGQRVRATVDPACRQTEFVGYHKLSVQTTTLRVIDLHAEGPARLAVLLKVTPFYGEAGGQDGDTGKLTWQGGRARVVNTVHQGHVVVHQVAGLEGRLSAGQEVQAAVDEDRRRAIERHHTATHLLHAALRHVLGSHVQQQGSHVGPDRFRFDFSHYQGLSPEELRRVEEAVNLKVMEDLPVRAEELAYQEALDRGALAFFGEKYGERVRMMQVGDVSTELCGGTHLRRTGEIGFFAITRETAAAAGVRRIEAVAGQAAYTWWRERCDALQEASMLVKGLPEELPSKVAHLQAEVAALRKEVDRLRRGEGLQVLQELVGNAVEVGGVRVASGIVQAKNRGELRAVGDALRERLGTGVGALASPSEAGCMLITVVTRDLSETGRLNAGELASALAGDLGGSGGGRPHLGEGGAKDCERLPQVLDSFAALVGERLGIE